MNLDSYVWDYVKIKLAVLRKMKKENHPDWESELTKLNIWLSEYKHRVIEHREYIFTITPV